MKTFLILVLQAFKYQRNGWSPVIIQRLQPSAVSMFGGKNVVWASCCACGSCRHSGWMETVGRVPSLHHSWFWSLSTNTDTLTRVRNQQRRTLVTGLCLRVCVVASGPLWVDACGNRKWYRWRAEGSEGSKKHVFVRLKEQITSLIWREYTCMRL